MTLTALELAPFAVAVKANIDAIIAKPSPTPAEITASQVAGFDFSNAAFATLPELNTALHAGYDLGISTFADLDTHLAVYAANADLLTFETQQRFRFLSMPARIRAVHEDNITYVASSGNITVPDDCYLLKVSFQAAGGSNGISARTDGTNAYSGGAGGGGAACDGFEIPVTPGEVIPLTLGNTLIFGALTIEMGGNGANHSVNGRAGGLGGRVLWNGAAVDDGLTAISGTAGMAGSVQTAVIAGQATTSNGKKQGGGGGVTGIADYVGSGGGASAASDGLDGIATAHTVVADARQRPIGTGSPSPRAVNSSSNLFDVGLVSQPGGAHSPTVIINFVQQLA